MRNKEGSIVPCGSVAKSNTAVQRRSDYPVPHETLTMDAMRRWFLPLALFYLVALVLLIPARLAIPVETTFSSDALAYNTGAINLVTQNFYSYDGVTPAIEREPGYSFFLSLIYRVFGMENRAAIFLLQGILHLLATAFFVKELRKIVSAPATMIAAGFLLLLPSVFHIIISAYRESFALTLSMFFAALYLSMRFAPAWWKAMLMGAVLSWLILTHIPFLFLPLVLLIVGWFFTTFPRRFLLAILALPVLVCLLWGYRNYQVDGKFRMVGSFRMAALLERRAIQAKTFGLWDPLKCRISEYITRDRSTASPYCGMRYENVLKNDPILEEQIIAESKTAILQNLPNYLWQSGFFALEMHLPYVNGWGTAYNILETLLASLLFLGCLLALPWMRRREYALFIAMILYATALSGATEAVPRYHMVTLFCYALLAGVGYSAVAERLRTKN